MNLSESYKKRLGELSGTKIISESSVIKDELNSLPFKKDIEALGGKVYSVGGRVRDEIIGKKSKDLDILITGVPLDRLEHILINYGKVKEVGKSFGIIKFIPFGQKEEIDIAIPRTEKKKENGSGYKGFDIKSDHTLPVETDLQRRDFTINSIAQDSKGNVIDPFNGREDLKNKIIRATSEQAFGDDPVRMLRAINFSARFGFKIEPNTMALIQKNANKIKEEPAERYITEFDKIIKKGDIQYGFNLLLETGLLKVMLGFDYAGNKDFSKVKTLADFLYKLVENSNVDIVSFIKKTFIKDIIVLNQIKALELQEELIGDKLEDRKTVQKILNLSPNIQESGLLNDNVKSIIKTFINGTYPLNTKDLEINGNDLMDMGFKKEQIGNNLSLIMKSILSDKIPNKKEDIIKFLETNKEQEKLKEKPEDNNKDVPPDSIYAINETRKIVRNFLFENFLDKSDDYKKWKRKNVTYRGISKTPGDFNDAGAKFGEGLYTAFLSNKSMAKGYGTLYFVVNAIPKNPRVFKTVNEAEIWMTYNLFRQYKNLREFNANTTIHDEMLKLGYDGIIIKGREMVNYKPENVLYFRTENELIDYYNNSVRNNIKENLEVNNLNKYLYHTSAPFNRERIENNGIVPHRGKQWLSDTEIEGKAVFATNSDNPKDWFDSTYDDDVWRIDVSKIPNIKWFIDPNFGDEYKHIYTKKPIPRNAIELIKIGTGKDLL